MAGFPRDLRRYRLAVLRAEQDRDPWLVQPPGCIPRPRPHGPSRLLRPRLALLFGAAYALGLYRKRRGRSLEKPPVGQRLPAHRTVSAIAEHRHQRDGLRASAMRRFLLILTCLMPGA